MILFVERERERESGVFVVLCIERLLSLIGLSGFLCWSLVFLF